MLETEQTALHFAERGRLVRVCVFSLTSRFHRRPSALWPGAPAGRSRLISLVMLAGTQRRWRRVSDVTVNLGVRRATSLERSNAN